MKRPGIFHGSVVGALLTAFMIALFLLIWEIAGLSFPPFDLFDWLSGILPGSVVTYGIGKACTWYTAGTYSGKRSLPY